MLAVLLVLPAALAGCTVAGTTPLPATGTGPHPTPPVALSVTPSTGAWDAASHVVVTGLRRGQDVTVRVGATSADGSRWSSAAQYVSAGPRLELDRTAPRSGSYSGVDGMGLVESMSPSGRAAYFFPGTTSQTLTFELVAGGRTVTARVDRPLVAPGERAEPLALARDGVVGRFYRPPPTTPRQCPAVLVLGGSSGGLTQVDQAALLAAHGYPALALAYFDEPGLPQALDRIPLEYFAQAAALLRARDECDGSRAGRIAVWGISRGSEAALLLAAHYPDLVGTVIAGSPSSVTNPPFQGTAPVHPGDPAWTIGGQPVPVAAPLGDPQSRGEPGAVIPVERIRGRVLLIVGDEDALWPSRAYAEAIVARLDARHAPAGHDLVEVAGGGHVVGEGVPFIAETAAATGQLGGDPWSNAVGGTRAWQQVLRLLATPARGA